MRMLIFLPVVAALGLQAQGVRVITGNSTLRGGKLQSTKVGSILEKEISLDALQGGEAILEGANGGTLEVHCEVKTYPGDGNTEIAIWRVPVPASMTLKSLKSLKVSQGSRPVAQIATATDLAPAKLDCFEAPSGEGVTLAWVLQRPERYKEASIWVRWSKDEGRTWMGDGRIFVGDSDSGELELDAATVGAPGTLIVEFWIPQDLNLTKIRRRIGQKDVK